MIPQDLQYAHPSLLYLVLLVLFFLLLFWSYDRYRQKKISTFAKNPKLLMGQSQLNFWGKVVLFCSIWFFACLTIMQPKGDAHYLDIAGNRVPDIPNKPTAKRKMQDVIFLVDASASMGVKDGRNGASRLEDAKEMVDQIAARLSGEQASLYTFTSEAIKLSPVTMDMLFVRMRNENIEINEGGVAGTNIAQALKSLHFSPTTSVILLSDGGDTRIESLQGKEREKAINDLVSYTTGAKHVFTIGVGTKKGEKVPGISEDHISKLNESLLKEISTKGHGRYYATDELSVVDIAKDITDSLAEELQYSTGEPVIEHEVFYDLYFQIPLGIALILLVGFILIPERWTKKIAFLLLFIPSLHAQELETAEAWYQAGAYDKAIDIYQQMLQKPLTPYQEAVVRFNIGTAYLDEGRWEDAIKIFRSINMNAASPLLKRRLNTNTVVARLREEVKAEDLFKKIYLMRNALQAISYGEQYHCQLATIIQAPTCEPAPNLKEMRAFLENDLSTALINIQSYQINNATYAEAVPLLLSHVQQMLENLNFLEKKGITPELDESYRKLFLNESETWTPLWEKLYEKGNPPQRFINARQYNKYGQFMLRDGKYEASRKHYQASADLLLNLIRNQKIPEQEALYQLLQSYQRALLQEPVQEIALQAILEEQQHIQGLNNSILEEGIKLAKLGKPIEAKIQIEVAKQEIINVLREKTATPSPAFIIEAAIESQEHALNLARLVEEAPHSLGKKSLQQAQEYVLLVANPFFDEVIKKQQIQYAKTGKCQRTPWKTVVPLFYNGLQAARTAAEVEDKMNWQEQALNNWREALEELKNKKEEPQIEKNIDKVIINLRQMEKEDQLQKPQQTIIQKGKPW